MIPRIDCDFVIITSFDFIKYIKAMLISFGLINPSTRNPYLGIDYWLSRIGVCNKPA